MLQAGAIGKSEELYLLDMGEPVKIVELAKDIVRLNGLDPDADIELNIRVFVQAKGFTNGLFPIWRVSSRHVGKVYQ